MDESQTILQAFEQLLSEGRSAALATVVRVAGSSYRRPGARMLIAMDGRCWGGVSGGCLERDVSRRGRQVIETGTPQVNRYDTSDDFGPGTALGCAGIIDILIERVSIHCPGPFPALHRVIRNQSVEVLGTVIDTSTGSPVMATRHTLAEDISQSHPAIREALTEIARSGVGGLRVCDGAEIFFEVLRPPQNLVLYGGGPDVVPVMGIAKILGWHVTVVTSHAIVGYRERFAAADVVGVGTDDDPLGGVAIHSGAAIVLMTHHYARDLLLLPLLFRTSPAYIGLLGPRRRAERLVSECPNLLAEAVVQLHAPVGMDVGADTPQAIALAIIAEIQAVLANRPSLSLKDRPGPIYPHDTVFPEARYTPTPCPT